MPAPAAVATGEPITSTKVNEIIAAVGPVATYTPTITSWNSATIAPTTTGRYWRTGDIVHVLVQSKLGTGTITVGAATVSLPVAADTTGMILDSTLIEGMSCFNDVNGSIHMGAVRIKDANTVQPMRQSTAGSGAIAILTSALPFTWATLDEMSLMFSYPVA